MLPNTSPLSRDYKRIPVIDPPSSLHTPGFEYRQPDWPWIMIPQGESRQLTLGIDTQSPVVFNGLNKKGEFLYLGSALCHVKLFGSLLTIRGLYNRMNIPIDLYQPGRNLRIFVSVKLKLKVYIIAHYVEHGPLLKTRITREQLREVIKHANAILTPHANIYLVLAIEGTLSYERIGKRLGSSVNDAPSDGRENEGVLFKKHKKDIPTPNGRLINLFLVRSLKRETSNPYASMDAEGCCIFEDHLHFSDTYDTKRAGVTLAHEVVHYLIMRKGPFQPYIDNNLPGEFDPAHTSDPKSLMYPHAMNAPYGNRLSRAEIEQINPSLPSSFYRRPIIDPFSSEESDNLI